MIKISKASPSHLGEKVTGTVDHLRLRGEAIRTVDEPHQLHNACHSVKIAQILCMSTKPERLILSNKPSQSTPEQNDPLQAQAAVAIQAPRGDTMATLTLEGGNKLNGHLSGSFFRLFFADILTNLQVVYVADKSTNIRSPRPKVYYLRLLPRKHASRNIKLEILPIDKSKVHES